jgi:hypothetical protein
MKEISRWPYAIPTLLAALTAVLLYSAMTLRSSHWYLGFLVLGAACLSAAVTMGLALSESSRRGHRL